MAKPMQSVDPTLLALNVANTAAQNAKKIVPASLSTPAIAKPPLNVQTQQSQAISTPPTAKVGGISSPFGVPNINSSPVLGGATPTEIGTRAKELQSLPKAMPKTGSNDNQKYIDLQIDIKKGMPFEKMKELYNDIPESAQSDLYNDLKRGMPIEKISELYPELQGGQPTPLQGGVKGGASREGFNLGKGEWINPVGKVFEEIDKQLQRIPTVSQEQVKSFLNDKLGGFGADLSMLPTMAVNTPGSLLKTAGAIGRGLTNPLDTITGLYNLVASKEGRQALGDRYGSIDGLQKTISEDPVGVASDILTIVQGGAGLAGKGAKLAGLPKTATKLGQISDIAGGASNLGMDIIPQGLNKLASKPGIVGKIGTVLNAPVSPLQTAGKLLPEKGVKEYATRDFPISRIEKDLGLTPTSRAIVERTGVTPGEYILSKNLGGVAREIQINELAKIADDSYNGITNQLKNIETRTPSPDAKKMLTTMVDEMQSSKILAREYPDYIAKLNELGSQVDYSPSELLAIRRDFDRIVGNQMFNAQGRVSGVEDKTIAGRRSKLADQLETIGNENGIDIKEMNTDIRNSTAIRDGLLRRLSQENKNNTFGLQDIGVGAILSAGNPVVATAIVIGKKALENAVPGISQSLYNLNKAKNVPRDLNRGVPITPSDTTNGLSITPDAPSVRATPGKVEPLRLPLKEGATVFPGSKGQLGNIKPPVKTPPITVEKGAIGMGTPKATVLPPKPTVAPSVSAPKTTTVSQIESKLNNLIGDKTYNKNTIDEFIKKAQDIPGFGKEYLGIKKIKTKEDLIKFVNKQVKKNNIPDAIDEISDTPIDMSPEARKKTMDGVMKAMGKPPAPKGFKGLGKETMEQNISKADDSLIQEAKKYKSAYSFIEAKKYDSLGLDKEFFTKKAYGRSDQPREKVGTVGDAIKDTKLRKQFVDVLDIPIYKSEGGVGIAPGAIGQYQKQFNRIVIDFPKFDDINVANKIEKTFFEEVLHSLRSKKGRTFDGETKQYLDRIEEITAKKGSDYFGSTDKLKQIREQANKKPLPPLPKKGK